MGTVSRYIDADELKKLTEEEFKGVCVYEVSPDEAVSDFCDVVDNCPSADVAPVVHGRWIEELDNVLSCRCSVCEHTYKIYEDDINGYPYCAWCGAKMDESEGEQ